MTPSMLLNTISSELIIFANHFSKTGSPLLVNECVLLCEAIASFESRAAPPLIEASTEVVGLCLLLHVMCRAVVETPPTLVFAGLVPVVAAPTSPIAPV